MRPKASRMNNYPIPENFQQYLRGRSESQDQDPGISMSMTLERAITGKTGTARISAMNILHGSKPPNQTSPVPKFRIAGWILDFFTIGKKNDKQS